MSLSPDHETLFKTWLEEYQGIVVKISRSFSATPVDCDELQQELLLQLWISAKSFTGQAKASTWIYRVCLNTAMTWRRGTERWRKRMDPTADVSQLLAGSASPAESAGDREILDKLYAAIHAMPTAGRALVLLSLDGLAYREIAEIMGMTETHVGVALTRARKHLSELMKGVTDELE